MSTTLTHDGLVIAHPGWLAGVLRRFAAAGTTTATGETAQQLLDRAAAYESTQPGFAADLRAAAQRMVDAA